MIQENLSISTTATTTAPVATATASSITLWVKRTCHSNLWHNSRQMLTDFQKSLTLLLHSQCTTQPFYTFHCTLNMSVHYLVKSTISIIANLWRVYSMTPV